MGIEATLLTTLGAITLSLMPETAPKACENFVTLAEKGYYNGISFHRVIPQFMIQGGDPTGTGAGGESCWGKAFADECSTSVRFDRAGLLAMANRGPNTNGSQFFITTVSCPWLNGKHTIFGSVKEGMDVLTKIEQTKTDGRDRPMTPVVIEKVTIHRHEQVAAPASS